MGYGKPLNASSAYELQSKLYDYNSMIKSFDEYALTEQEEELMVEFSKYYPDMVYELERLFDAVHDSINKGYYDTDEIDETIADLVKRVGYYSDRRSTMKYACVRESNDYAILAKGINFILQNSIEKDPYAIFDTENDKNDYRNGLIKSQSEKVYNIIINSKGPVTKEYLATVIDGLQDQAVYVASCSADILNYRGLYIYEKNIDISKIEKSHLLVVLEEHLRKKSIVHVDELLQDISYRFKDLLRRVYVKSSYQLFSFLQHYFSKDFKFVRPFVANLGTEIEPMEQVKAFLDGYEEISVDEYLEFLKDSHIKIYSMIDSISQVDNLFVLKNKDTMMRLNKTGIDNSTVHRIIDLISCELENTPCLAIRDLQCRCEFPSIYVPWDEWLIFSIVRKYAKSLHVLLSSKYYKSAIPIIAKPGCADKRIIESIAKQYYGEEKLNVDKASIFINVEEELGDELLLYEDE